MTDNGTKEHRTTEPLLRPLKIFVDERGMLTENYNADLPFVPIRSYTVFPRRGIVRAFHGHLKEYKSAFVPVGSAKFITMPIGSVDKDTLVDKKGMRNFILDARKPCILIIPPNYYHGFVALDDITVVVFLSSMSVKESEMDDFRLPFNTFGDIWRLESK